MTLQLAYINTSSQVIHRLYAYLIPPFPVPSHDTQNNGESNRPDASIKKSIGKAFAQAIAKAQIRMRKSTDGNVEKSPKQPA